MIMISVSLVSVGYWYWLIMSLNIGYQNLAIGAALLLTLISY